MYAMNNINIIIKLLHLVIIVAIIISVFIQSCNFKKLVLTFLIFLFLQYMFGYEKCGLTELEYWIIGEGNHKQGFIYRIINPIIKIPEKYINNGLAYVHILWICILLWQINSKKCHPK